MNVLLNSFFCVVKRFYRYIQLNNFKTTCFRLVFIITLFFSNSVFSISPAIKTLERELSSAKDSARVKILIQLCYKYSETSLERAMLCGEQALSLSKEIHYLYGKATALEAMAVIYSIRGIEDKSLDYYKQSLSLALSNSFKNVAYDVYGNMGDIYLNKRIYNTAFVNYQQALQIAIKSGKKIDEIAMLNSIATLFYFQSKHDTALDYYLKALKLSKRIGNGEGIAQSSLNIGNVYHSQNEYDKALKFYEDALAINQTIGNKEDIGKCTNNIGTIYEKKKDYDKALGYYMKALVLKEDLNDKNGIENTLSNIGNIYFLKNKFTKGIEYYNRCLKLSAQNSNKNSLAKVYTNLGKLYLKEKEYDQALVDLSKGLSIAKEIGRKDFIHTCYEELAEVYSEKGNYKMAFEYHKQYALVKDSILNEQTSRNIAELQTQYETVEKEKEIELLTRDQKLNEAELSNQRILIFSIIGGAVFLLLLTILLYNRYQLKQKSEKEISKKNKDITASITYAKRIQDALLKDEEHFSTHLPSHFIFLKPKDIVSGDFHWTLEKQDYWYFGAVDCTGHGVPGGFMSMLGIAFLNEINASVQLLNPAEILEQLRHKIMKELHQTGAAGESKDGMDISLARFDIKTKELQWSGANNSLYHIHGNELIEIKADKQPIGYHPEPKPFVNHSVQLQKGESIYLFTDGFPDQFGGPKKRKFMYKPLKDLLLSIQHKSAEEQKTILSVTLSKWMEKEDQTDDILVMGVKC
jgi:tetratricopeptide (TPR) repeat protein